MTDGIRIPKLLHQIWLGPNPLPEEQAGYVETWRTHHPDWEHRLWREDDLDGGFVRNEVHERLRHPVERSDLLRLELVHRFGGLYVDTDVECLRPIDPLVEGVTFGLAGLYSGRVSNFLIAGLPGNAVLRRAIDEMQPLDYHGLDKNVSGPDYLASFVGEDAGVTIFPTEAFLPRTPDERRNAFAFHHELGQWKDTELNRNLAERWRRRLRRTEAELDELEQRHRETVAELDAARARLAGNHGRALVAGARVVAVRAPHRLREAARAVKRKLRTAG